MILLRVGDDDRVQIPTRKVFTPYVITSKFQLSIKLINFLGGVPLYIINMMG